MRNQIDKPFLFIVISLMLGGFFIFMSASMGLLARGGAEFGVVVFNQAFFGLIVGSFAVWLFSRINYKLWKKYSIYIFVLSVISTLLVFVPMLGFSHGGAKRWLLLGPFSVQPAEFLKLGVIVYLAVLFSKAKLRIHLISEGPIPLLIILGVSGIPLFLQPDTGTFLVITATAFSMFIIAGGRWKHIAWMFVGATLGFAALIASKPYIMERILTFVNPSRDPSGAGWQLKQALIAIGSGGLGGKGFGQSIQKFNFLPEPIGDSIFAVSAEEFGFIGAVIIITAFLLFLLRGLYIARRSPDGFSGLLVSGIVIMIVVQAYLNISAMLGVLPLTGVPLIFISKGGTAILFALIGVGIVLNVSRYKRKI